MSKRITGLIVLVIAFLASGVAPAQHKMPWHDYRRALFALSKVESSDVVMLGDWLTEGAGWFELTGCSRLVKRGVGVDTTAKLLARHDETLALKPRAVFLMVGVNDISLAVPKATTEANYRTILDRLAGRHVVVAYVLPVAASYPKPQIN